MDGGGGSWSLIEGNTSGGSGQRYVKKKKRKRISNPLLCSPSLSFHAKTHSVDIAINILPQVEIKTCWMLQSEIEKSEKAAVTRSVLNPNLSHQCSNTELQTTTSPHNPSGRVGGCSNPVTEDWLFKPRALGLISDNCQLPLHTTQHG